MLMIAFIKKNYSFYFIKLFFTNKIIKNKPKFVDVFFIIFCFFIFSSCLSLLSILKILINCSSNCCPANIGVTKLHELTIIKPIIYLIYTTINNLFFSDKKSRQNNILPTCLYLSLIISLFCHQMRYLSAHAP